MERDVSFLVGHVYRQHALERLVGTQGLHERLGDMALPAGPGQAGIDAAFNDAQQAVDFHLVHGRVLQGVPGAGQQRTGHVQQRRVLKLDLVLVRPDDLCPKAIFGGAVEIVDNHGVHHEVMPLANRLIIFNSDLQHQVQTAHRQRYSIATWMRRDGLVPFVEEG